MMDSPIFVTRALLPAKDLFLQYVDQIFASRQLTNNGPLVVKLEQELRAFLAAKYLALCSNGTLSLMLGIRALGLTGKKVIVTPFTYVATLTALLWEQCQPVFVDIDRETLCLAPELVEQALERDGDIAGILPVHVYGVACDVQALGAIAAKFKIPILYDASHAFGVDFAGQSLLNYGELSVCSFHATKVFHTVEGGVIICHGESALHKVQLLRAFGHINDNYMDIGINAKLSEFHAAMGLALLRDLEQFRREREEVFSAYQELLAGKDYQRPKLNPKQTQNYAYYPLILPNEQHLLGAMARMAKHNIHPRRYFYPSCNTMPYLAERTSCPVSEDISRRILCLPIFPGLPKDKIATIVECLG